MYGGTPYAGAGMVAADIPADTDTHLAVEVAFTTDPLADDPAWVDIAGDCRSWDTTRGRRRELERFQPGRATVVLSNLERQYDSVNAAGPWFGYLKPMRRMRIRETFNGVTYPMFDGYVDRWHLDYPGLGHDATATVTATDGFKILARTDLPDSVYGHVVSEDAADPWWRLDERLGGLALGEAVNSGPTGSTWDGTFVNDPEVGGQGLIVNEPGFSIHSRKIDANQNEQAMGVALTNPVSELLTLPAFSIEAWFRLSTAEVTLAGSANGRILAVYDSATGIVDMAVTNSSANFGDDRRIQFFVSIGGGAQTYGVFTPLDSIIPGKIHHVVAVIDESEQMAVYLDGVRYTDSTGLNGSNLTGVTRPTGGDSISLAHEGEDGNGFFNLGGDLAAVAIYRGVALTQAQVTTHYAAGTSPWQNDLPGARIIRILDIVGWPDLLREIDTGLTTLQSATLGTSALEHLQKVAETEFGLLFMSRDGKIRFVDRTTLFARLPDPVVYGDEP